MDTQLSTLPSGLRVVTSRLTGFATASISVFINAGSRDETDNNNGIAHFLEHMAFKGTATRSSLEIAREIEVQGAQVNAFTSGDTTAYYVIGLRSVVPKAVAILGDVLSNSAFAEEDVEMEKGVILQEIARDRDDPGSMVHDLHDRLAFPDHPLGQPILGSEAFVRSVTPEHFRHFLHSRYTASNMLVVGCGDVEHEELVRLVETHFTSFTDRPTTRSPAEYRGGMAVDRSKPFEQVSLVIGVPTVSVQHPTSMAHRLMGQMLGGGMSSPLFQEVRERRGLVYSVHAWSGLGADNGSLMISAGATPENMIETVGVSCGELRKMCETDRVIDLERAKNVVLVQLATQKERPFKLSQYIATSMFRFGRVVPFETRMQEVREVGIEDIRAAAHVAVCGNPTVALVGMAPEADYMALVRDRLAA